MSKALSKSWWFESKSNPDKNYETLQYTDGSTSCQCPGWTRRVDPNGGRSCAHTRMIQSGMADQECIKSLVHAPLDTQSGNKGWSEPAIFAPAGAPKVSKTKKPQSGIKVPAAEVIKVKPVARKILWNA